MRASELRPGDVVKMTQVVHLEYGHKWEHTVERVSETGPTGLPSVPLLYTKYDNGQPGADKEWKRTGGCMSVANMQSVMDERPVQVVRDGKVVYPFFSAVN